MKLRNEPILTENFKKSEKEHGKTVRRNVTNELSFNGYVGSETRTNWVSVERLVVLHRGQQTPLV